MLGHELGKKDAELSAYKEQANRIRFAIETYFGAKIQGFDAYRYYDGNEKLRAWIAIPLTVGIYDRKVGTVDALFSALWTDDGLMSQAGDKVFFDRSTLYALRGSFAAGETERALDFLKRYTNRRLLGDHVPYAVEWGPEGSQPHLAAESALYCRVFTEGLFGIRPTGFRSFAITPTLPKAWDRMQLRNIHAFGNVFDLVVTRAGDKLQLETAMEGQRRASQVFDTGKTISIHLNSL
jgi:hypothetical protein